MADKPIILSYTKMGTALVATLFHVPSVGTEVG